MQTDQRLNITFPDIEREVLRVRLQSIDTKGILCIKSSIVWLFSRSSRQSEVHVEALSKTVYMSRYVSVHKNLLSCLFSCSSFDLILSGHESAAISCQNVQYPPL